MLWLLTALVLVADPAPIHKPGVDGIECSRNNVDSGTPFWSCKAACWLTKKNGKAKPDGGLYGEVIHSEGPTESSARYDLDRQYRNGCKP